MTHDERAEGRVPATYWQLTLVVPAGSSASLATALRDLGALGVLDQRLDDTRSSLSALFDASLGREELLDRVRARVAHLADLGVQPPTKIRASALTADDWAEAWPEYFVPVAVGRRLLIVPAWFDTPASDRITIVLDAGGFGTGHHPSTAGCLQALEAIVEREPAEHAIDLGCGSGILAIAAALLGVGRVTAVDNDREAVMCAVANVEKNHVSDRVRCVQDDASAVALGPAPLVVANLLAPVHGVLAGQYPGLVTPGAASCSVASRTPRPTRWWRSWREKASPFETGSRSAAGRRWSLRAERSPAGIEAVTAE